MCYDMLLFIFRLRVTMLPTKSVLVSSLFLSAILGCEQNQLGTIDTRNTAPFLSNILLSPDSIFVDDLTPDNGLYTIFSAVRVDAKDPDGSSDIAAVRYDVIGVAGTIVASGIELRDDGIAPDSIAGDDLFSAPIRISLTRPQARPYLIRVFAMDRKGDLSVSLYQQLKITRRNSAPQLFDLLVPDSIDLPSSGYVTVQFQVSAADSDGLADIQQVHFRRLDPVDPSETRFIMKDDGSADPAVGFGGIFLRSGDDVAGDGRFSFLIPVFSSASRRTNLFGFQAVDGFGDTSATALGFLTIR